MSSTLATAIADLTSADAILRAAAARSIYRQGRVIADRAVEPWWKDAELGSLLCAPGPSVTVGLAVSPASFDAIRKANDSPRLANVPPDQDAQEFELHFADGVALDILTSKDPAGKGAIARYLARFGPGIQQVEFRCENVDRATELLREKFAIAPLYPAARPGADRTRINFFLVADPEGGKVLVELYEPAA